VHMVNISIGIIVQLRWTLEGRAPKKRLVVGGRGVTCQPLGGETFRRETPLGKHSGRSANDKRAPQFNHTGKDGLFGGKKNAGACWLSPIEDEGILMYAMRAFGPRRRGLSGTKLMYPHHRGGRITKLMGRG